MSSLGNEKDSWIDASKRLGSEKESLLGDMIISSSFVTYLGPFEGIYRDQIVQKKWKQFVINKHILVSEVFSL